MTGRHSQTGPRRVSNRPGNAAGRGTRSGPSPGSEPPDHDDWDDEDFRPERCQPVLPPWDPEDDDEPQPEYGDFWIEPDEFSNRDR